MKQLGNLALVCAQRPEIVMQIHEGMVSIHVGTGPNRAVMSAAWNNDMAINRIIQELNFGRYARKHST